MYVLEYINGCCFTHDAPIVYGKYKTAKQAIDEATRLQKFTKKYMKNFDIYITEIRIIDLKNYPKEVYTSQMKQYLYELNNDEIPEWRVDNE